MSTDSFHIVYNAKNVAADKVAESFILHPDFEALQKNNHTVLLGARGCGKTTLMKMLTLPALYNWDHIDAEKTRKNLPFVTVYIPTDIYWNTNNEALYDDLHDKFPKYARAVSEADVTLRVLKALHETFENILKYEIGKTGKEKIIEFSKILIKEWRLPPTIPDLSRIEGAIAKNGNDLGSHIKEVVYNFNADKDIKYDREYFKLDFHKASEVAIKEFVRIFDYKKDINWAFCFDELEIAPTWLQNRLFTGLRSLGDQKILYKLSASPIASIPKESLASSPHDVILIKMWPHSIGKKYEHFSKDLIDNILKNRFNMNVDPELIFGSNHLYARKGTNQYERGGTTWEEIRKLAQVDKAFRQYLINSELNPDDPSVTDTNKGKLDTVLRKMNPIVFFRSYYREYKEYKIKKERKSRKANTLYYGKEVIYKICDGNPRWLKGLMDMMLSHLKEGKIKKIKENIQAQELTKISERFLNSVEAYPKPSIIQSNNKLYTLKDIINMIGEYFQNDILGKKFKTEPYSIFKVDKNIEEKVDRKIITIIKKATYQGAFILIDPLKEGFDIEVKDKEFRLAYLFCPKFKLPVRKFKPISLSECIKPMLSKRGTRYTKGKNFNSNVQQGKLFSE